VSRGRKQFPGNRSARKGEVEAILKNDLETLGRLWSDDLIAASNENLILTKRQLLVLFDGGLIQIKSLERHFSQTFVTGHSAFVVSHLQTVSKIGAQAGLVEYSSYLSSWICIEGVGSWPPDIQPLWRDCPMATVDDEV
jgi:Domain of unknown function (DUF4440)